MNVRPDVWVFPFLNVYGIFGYGRSKTSVQLVEPVELNTTIEQNLRTAGVGVMGAFGIGSAWVSLDGNWTWSKPELLDKPVRVSYSAYAWVKRLNSNVTRSAILPSGWVP